MSEGVFPLIFIVEDDELFLKMVEEHLKINKLNHTKSFLSGEECLENLLFNPDIVIMDYELGQKNGIELMRKIKEYDENICVIMLTKSDELEVALQALQEGAYDYIHKDEISFRLLKSLIDKIIKDHKKGIIETTNTEMTGFKRFLKT